MKRLIVVAVLGALLVCLSTLPHQGRRDIGLRFAKFSS